MDKEPTKNTLMQRYELEVDGHTAILEYKEEQANVVAFTHTFVPPALRGRNIAAVLTRYALEDVRAQEKKVQPLCSYTATYMARHKEVSDLLAIPPVK